MRKIAIILAVVAVILIGIGFYVTSQHVPGAVNVDQSQATTTPTTGAGQAQATSTILGVSVEGRDIIAYHYGTGSKELLFIGGIHGGYEWNTILVAYQMMDYLAGNPSIIPANVKVTVIPVMNPDGLYKVVGTTDRFTQAQVPKSEVQTIPGRFNAHTVDLGRNFDCDWKSAAVWQNKPVSGGSAAFSEPESQAIKKYIEEHQPAAAVTWYSAVGGVFSSSCHNGVSAETTAITKAYADASGYPAHESFDFYATTGDMVNWFAKKNIPAISVLLTNHTDTEWTKNQSGIQAIFAHYAQ